MTSLVVCSVVERSLVVGRDVVVGRVVVVGGDVVSGRDVVVVLSARIVKGSCVVLLVGGTKLVLLDTDDVILVSIVGLKSGLDRDVDEKSMLSLKISLSKKSEVVEVS